MKKIVLCLTAVMAATALSSSPVTAKPLPITAFPPYELETDKTARKNKQIRVIVADVKNSSPVMAAEKVNESIRGKLRQLSVESGAQMVDLGRSLRGELAAEIKALESTGSSNYRPSQPAEMAIMAEKYAAKLEAVSGLEVIRLDERLSSVEAEAIMKTNRVRGRGKSL